MIFKMRFLFLIFLMLFVTFSCKKEEIDYENSRTSYYNNIKNGYFNDSVIVCVTFNIHLGFKSYQDPWDKDDIGADEDQVKLIANHLKKINPDIIALQEVPLYRYNAKIKFFLEALAKEMDMNYAFGSHGYNDPTGIYPVYGEWGTAIMTRYKILKINNVQVEYVSKWEKRSMLDACIEINHNEQIHVISLHYLPIDEGIPNTANYLKQITEPLILMGDFNYTGEIADFLPLGLRDVDSTYQNNEIDRIFYSGFRFKCIDYGFIPDSLWWISDHPANYGKLKI